MFKPTVLAAAMAAGFSLPVIADEQTSDTPMIVISGRSPEAAGLSGAPVRIISRADIDASGARNVADLLQRAAIIQLIDANGDGSAPAVAMRGFGENGAQNSLIMIDGRRLNNDTDLAAPDLRNIALARVDHIEIVNGSAGALYGNSAVGGVINIVTREASGNEAVVGVSRGTQDTEGYRLDTTGKLNDLTASLQGEKTLTDNYRQHNQSDRSQVQGRLAYALPVAKLYLEAGDQRVEENHPGALFNPQYQDSPRDARYLNDYSDTHNQRYTAGSDISLSDNWLLKLEGARRDDASHGILSQGGVAYRFDQSRRQDSLNPRLTGQSELNPDWLLKLVVGVDQDKGNYHFVTSMGAMDDDQDIRSVYSQLRFIFDHRIEVTAGGRHAEYRATMRDAFTYKQGVNLHDDIDVGSLGVFAGVTDKFRVWVRMDDNYRFATLDEQTNIPFGAVNPLKTQTGRSWETGADYHEGGFRSALQLYRLRLENEIAYDALQYANVNLNHTRRNGASWDLDYAFTPRLSLNTQAAWVDARFTDGPSAGKRVPFIASNHQSVAAVWQPVDAWTLSLEGNRTGRRYPASDWNNSLGKLPAQNLLNVAGAYRHGNLSTRLRVNNLLDKRTAAYASAAYHPYPTQDTAYMPAPGRTAVLSLDYAFR